MILFLRKISATTHYDDIASLIEPVLKGGLLSRRKGQIRNVQMLIIKDNARSTLEYHGLVTVEPDEIAEKVIEKLSKRLFQGRVIEVRPYIYRSWKNDPRTNKQPPNFVLICERKGDRRRRNLEKKIINHNAHGQFVCDFDFW
jgi:hypothetical protein